MDFYITDRTFALQAVISTKGNTQFKVIKVEDVSNLETSSRRMTMDVSFTPETTGLAKQVFKVGNYVLYKDLNGKQQWQTIMQAEHDPLNQMRSLEMESAGLDLLNETTSDYKASKAQNIAFYINYFTDDSGFKIGINEVSKLTRTLEWEGEETALERILSVAKQFDNAELEFRFEFSGNQLVQRYIDIKKKRGTDELHRMYVNRDIHSITTKEDIYSLVNAIYPTGGTPEGKDDAITLKGYNYTDPSGRFYLDKSRGILKDTQNVKMWSRTNTANNYFLQHKSYETTNQKSMLDDSIKHLKEYSVPVMAYTVDIAKVPDGLVVGDYVELVDENEELYLKSRVQQLTFDYATEEVQAELSDFVRLKSGIAEQLRDIQISIENKTEQKFNSVPQVFVQPEAPTSPKENDIWWVQTITPPTPKLMLLSDSEPQAVEGDVMVTAYKVFKDGVWQEQTIDQSVLNIQTLNAVNINGSIINGSQLINTFTTSIAGQTFQGSTTIEEGEVDIEFSIQETNQTGSTRMYPKGFDTRTLNPNGSVNSYASLTPAGLSLQDQNANSGFLTAELVMQFANTGQRIWTGPSWVTNTNTLTPTLSMDKVAIGWLFLWQPYDTTNGVPYTWDYTYYLVPKAHANFNNGKGISMRLQGAGTGGGANDIVYKYVYVSKTTISGTANNGLNNGAKWVLTAVFSV